MENIIAAVILALTISGLANIFITGKRWIMLSRSRMAGAELGKQFLDPLQMQVRQDTWADPGNCLGTGTAAACPDQTAGAAQGLDRNYTAHYTVTPGTPIGNVTKVLVNITWDEPTP